MVIHPSFKSLYIQVSYPALARATSSLTSSEGKILTDTHTIGTYDIKEKDFIVLMVSKVRDRLNSVEGMTRSVYISPNQPRQ